jgi:hypothetical protein
MQKTINGRTFDYEDKIIHHTTSVFCFWDRIKILFGKRLIISSVIYTKAESQVVGSESEGTWVEPFVKSKLRGMAENSVSILS